MKRIIAGILCAVVILCPVLVINAGAAYNDALTSIGVNSHEVYMVNTLTGDVVFSKNEDEQHAPASLTKIITAKVAIDKCSDLKKKVVVTSACYAPLTNTNSSMLGLKNNESISIEDLLYGMMLSSGNDAANAVAIAVSGSIEAFVKQMNVYVKELGCTNTQLVNTHGLDEQGHYTTAKDMYIITSDALKNKDFARIANAAHHTIEATNKSAKRNLTTSNPLLVKGDYYYEYASGVKTGTTDKAGKCLVTTAKNGAYEYMLVLLGAYYDTQVKLSSVENGAAADAKKLFDWAFGNISHKTLCRGTEALSSVNVKYGSGVKSINLIAGQEITADIPVDVAGYELDIDIKGVPDFISAPVSANTAIGEASFYCGSELISTVPLYTQTNADAVWFMKLISIEDPTIYVWIGLFIAVWMLIFCIMMLIRMLVNKKKYVTNKKNKSNNDAKQEGKKLSRKEEKKLRKREKEDKKRVGFPQEIVEESSKTENA